MRDYNQHDVGSFSRALACFVTTNLLAATSQRRYAIKRSECFAKRSTHAVEGPLAVVRYDGPEREF